MTKKQLKQERQQRINNTCIEMYNEAMEEYRDYKVSRKIKKFRKCAAETIETQNYIFLRSYNTIVCLYDKKEHIIVDVLRYVYGYTATSSQHINKFYNDLVVENLGKYGIPIITWKDL